MRKPLVLLLLLALFLTAPSASAQEATDPPGNLVHLQRATFDPLVSPQGRQQPSAPDISTSPYYLVQFSGPVEATWLDQVRALGGDVLGYVPDNTHVVRLPAAAVAPVTSLPAVRWVGPYLNEYKLAPALDGVIVARSNQAVNAYVVAFPGEDGEKLAAALKAVGASITQQAETALGPIFEIQVQASALASIAQMDGVSWIEETLPMQTGNAEGRQVMGAHQVWQNYGYFGKDQIVAVSDSGLSVQESISPDFAGRLIRAYAPSEMNLASAQCQSKTTWTDLNGHGTHVAGSVLGSGARSGSVAATRSYTTSHAGVAPEAQLVFMALNTDGSGSIQCIDINGDFLARGYENGARISTNSWGANSQGGYNLISSLVDDYVWKHKDYLVLFAAGNSGPGAQTVGAPGTAKNVLTVGATENNRPALGDSDGDDPNQIASFSSRGPTADNRIKPEVMAPGTWILSTRAAQAPDGSFWANFNADYAYMGGTSMATPLTAGGSALVREWVTKQRNITNPSGALMKALMIHGAQPLPGASAAPNPQSGWGRVDLKNTLDAPYVLLEDYQQGLTTGQEVTYTVTVVGTSAAGTLFTIDQSGAGQPSTETLTLQAQSVPSARDAQLLDLTDVGISALPGFERPTTDATIPTADSKDDISAQQGALPTLSLPAEYPAQSSAFRPDDGTDQAEAAAFLINLVGGGDFEDPGWTDFWQYVWLGEGIPLRTANPNLVLTGSYSMWLGGTELDDSIWYPFALPDTIDTANPSFLSFKLGIFDQDLGFDIFCVALVDASGYFIGPYASNGPECVEANGLYDYQINFTAPQLAELAGQSGYVVLFIQGDAAEPHMSAIVDDIVFAIDFPDPTLAATPNTGPAGTTFLLTGQYNTPYGEVAICDDACNSPADVIGVVYADGAGDLAAYLTTPVSLPSATYPLESRDFYNRAATTSITIGASSQPTLTVSPGEGQAGTTFVFSGEGFLPNDNIAVEINGDAIGTTGSNAQGEIAFTINTAGNTPAGVYTVGTADQVGNSAEAEFTVTTVDAGEASLTVAPASAVAGTNFVFDGANFTPDTPVQIALDGQLLGQLTTADDGTFQVTLETTTETNPGVYILQATQGSLSATAQFTILGNDDGGGGEPQSGGGLFLTLVWTDPPVQQGAAKTIVNNLDLSVTGPGGPYFGNGGSTADSVNTVETVRLSSPAAGQYIITVRATSVNGAFGAQPFALVGSTRQNATANTSNIKVQASPDNNIYLPAIER